MKSWFLVARSTATPTFHRSGQSSPSDASGSPDGQTFSEKCGYVVGFLRKSDALPGLWRRFSERLFRGFRDSITNTTTYNNNIVAVFNMNSWLITPRCMIGCRRRRCRLECRTWPWPRSTGRSARDWYNWKPPTLTYRSVCTTLRTVWGIYLLYLSTVSTSTIKMYENKVNKCVTVSAVVSTGISVVVTQHCHY